MFLSVFFASATTLIGAGILGLPVVLYDISATKFFNVLAVALSGQIILVVLTVEVLNSSTKILKEKQNIQNGQDVQFDDIGLSTLATLYLPRHLQNLFSFVTFFIYITALVCFGIAGTQSVANVLENSTMTASPSLLIVIVYFLIGICTVIFFGRAVMPALTILPYCESVALFLCILLIWSLPHSVRKYSFFETETISKFTLSKFSNPFLMSSATLSGLPATICVTYNWISKTKFHKKELFFLLSLISALVFSCVLNLFWVFAVFEVSYHIPHAL